MLAETPFNGDISPSLMKNVSKGLPIVNTQMMKATVVSTSCNLLFTSYNLW